MDNVSTLSPSWSVQLREQIADRPLIALGLLLALVAVLLLLVQSLVVLAAGDITAGMRYGLIGGAAGFAATALGALPALFVQPDGGLMVPVLRHAEALEEVADRAGALDDAEEGRDTAETKADSR